MTPPSPLSATTATALAARWADAWPAALDAWSKFTRLRPPVLCTDPAEAKREGMPAEIFAMIRLVDQAVIVDLPTAVKNGVEKFAVEILAHEIGHHVLAPANLTDHARLIARMRQALPTLERHAPLVANLYTDLLINDRLQRQAGLDLAGVYRALNRGESGPVFRLYLRTYELLWSLERGTLGARERDERIDADAWLASRVVRTYARDWLTGGARFATLLLPYLVEEQEKAAQQLAAWHDTREAAAGGWPDGVVDADASDEDARLHPSEDRRVTGETDDTRDAGDDLGNAPIDTARQPASRGQSREPYEYGEILRAASGMNLDAHDVAVRYYRERARPHLIRFPQRPLPASLDPLPEGLEPWDIGHPLDVADWFESVMQSPRIIPGVTTVQRTWGESPGREPAREPLDLDLYVDCSGSMPNPQQQTSFLTLAGAIISLSALRAGARVQATLWSGKQQFLVTPGFVRDETEILRVLTGFFGGGTQFPLHLLRDTYASGGPVATRRRAVHVLVISDDGVSTMFDARDERGTSGWTLAEAALARAQGGGTLVLNLPAGWDGSVGWEGAYATIRRARDAHGWNVFRVTAWDELVAFAREFSRRKFATNVDRSPARR